MKNNIHRILAGTFGFLLAISCAAQPAQPVLVKTFSQERAQAWKKNFTCAIEQGKRMQKLGTVVSCAVLAGGSVVSLGIAGKYAYDWLYPRQQFTQEQINLVLQDLTDKKDLKKEADAPVVEKTRLQKIQSFASSGLSTLAGGAGQVTWLLSVAAAYALARPVLNVLTQKSHNFFAHVNAKFDWRWFVQEYELTRRKVYQVANNEVTYGYEAMENRCVADMNEGVQAFFNGLVNPGAYSNGFLKIISATNSLTQTVEQIEGYLDFVASTAPKNAPINARLKQEREELKLVAGDIAREVEAVTKQTDEETLKAFMASMPQLLQRLQNSFDALDMVAA